MVTDLIQLNDGTLVEIELPEEAIRQVSGGVVRRVATSLEAIRPILLNACRAVVSSWSELREYNVDAVEVKLGLSFEAEGNVYLAKATAGANVTVTLRLKPAVKPT